MYINITDHASPTLQRLIAQFPQVTKSALKGTGYFVMKEVQKGIRSAAPGGTAYAPGMPINMKRRLNKVMGRYTSKLPLGKMSQAVKYKMNSNNDAVTIGWLSQSSQKLGQLIEQGANRSVTEKVLGLYHLAKVPIDKDKIDVPARHTWDPMYKYLAPKIPSEFQKRFYQKLEKVIGK